MEAKEKYPFWDERMLRHSECLRLHRPTELLGKTDLNNWDMTSSNEKKKMAKSLRLAERSGVNP